MTSKKLLVLWVLFISVQAYPQDRSDESESSLRNPRTNNDCTVETTCTEINKYQCQTEKEICRDEDWLWCKTIDKEIKVWKNVTECDENGECCEEKFKETMQTQQVEHCTVKTIPASECPSTYPRIVCKECKSVANGEGCDNSDDTDGTNDETNLCKPCLEAFDQDQNRVEYLSCLKSCSGGRFQAPCQVTDPDNNFGSNCEEAIAPGCEARDCTVASGLMEHCLDIIMTHGAGADCRDLPPVDSIEARPNGDCAKYCPISGHPQYQACQAVKDGSCQDVCQVIYPLAPAYLCDYCRGKNPTAIGIIGCLL